MDMNYRGECGREGVGRMEWSEGGGKWDNCNSIINKYINKYINKILKKKNPKTLNIHFPASSGYSTQTIFYYQFKRESEV